MKTLLDLNNISDGNLYDSNDMVKADTKGCNSCSDCCHGVGELVVLTPFDIYEIKKTLEVSFDELLNNKVELRENKKILLPYLKMIGQNERCSFLDENERCSIHKSRPNICRLFPLGRVYKNDDFKYFLQINNCPVKDLKETKVIDWIGIENYDTNKEFILMWHNFIKALMFRVKFVYDEKEIELINEEILNSFYRMEIREGEDFYKVFNLNFPNVKNKLGVI